jgi:hypothetical protein
VGDSLSDPLLLCATITRLSYALSQRHYEEKHYAWCAPISGSDSFLPNNPPSSDPIQIYATLWRDVHNGDEHSAKIKENRLGLLRGAAVKESTGVIDAGTKNRIEAIVARAKLEEFLPLLLIIPFAGVKKLLIEPEVDQVARATSLEYVIEELPRSGFEILNLGAIHG